MDPTLATALTKLVVGATGSVGGKLAGLLWNAAARDRRILSHPHNKVDLQKVENELLRITLTEVTLNAPPATIYEFVTSPVMATLTEQLILVGFAGARPSLEAAMREELRASLSAYLGRTTDEAVRLKDADAIFAALSKLTEAAVQTLRESGYRLTEEALQRMHYLILELYTSSIERNTRLLSGLRPESLERNNDFLRRLSAQVAFRYRHIEPPDFERIVRIPIKDMYVSPGLSEGIQPSLYGTTPLNLTNFGARIYRTVVLGDPGGGKSTLSAFFAHSIGNGDFRRDIFMSKTPLIVVLRDIRISERGPESILQYIEAVCETSFALRPPPNAIEYALLNGYLFLIFDGLDELLEPSNRGKVVEAIEAITNLYPNTFILVTSRRINYDAAPLDSHIFEGYTLNEFDDGRIEEYAYKYFGQIDDRSDEESQRTARAFLRESHDHAAEIRSNPLMLALMCRLYRGINYIPQNIPGLYQRCANMLFFTWDERRHIGPGLPFEYHIEPLMAHLGYWIFESGVTAVGESAVVERAKEYLQEWLISDSREAEAAAIAFVKYFRNRLWVFSEVGLTDEGESLYSFTHRTFLEYFAGMYLSTNAASNTVLAEELLPRLTSNQWDVVAQVAVYLRSRGEVRAADEIIQGLLQAAVYDDRSASTVLLGFIIRLLAFVVPRPGTLTRIVYATLDTVISLYDEVRSQPYDKGMLQAYEEDRMQVWRPLLVSLARARADNRLGITRSVVGYIENILNEPKTRVIRSVGAILQVPRVLAANMSGDASYIADLIAFWQNIADAIVEAAGASIRAWAMADEYLAFQAWEAGALSLYDFVSMRGAEVVFKRDPYSTVRDYPDPPVGIREQVMPVIPDLLITVALSQTTMVRVLEEWYDVALSLPTPWFAVEWLGDLPGLGPFMLYDVADSKKAFSSITLMIAAFYEAGTIDAIERASLGDLDGFKDVFMSRGQVPDVEAITRQLNSLAGLVTANCLELLRKWAMKELHLCSGIEAKVH